MSHHPHRVPVTLLTGFLGSGKSSLLNRLLREQPHRRFGLVVNEFGDAALESQLIEAQKRPLLELPAGCVCCVTDGDLEAALKGLLARDERIDHVLVEASGLSSPGPLVSLLTADRPEREFPFELGGVFCVVDASTFLEREPEWPILRRQLSFADAIFLTKTDLVTTEHRAVVEARLAERSPQVARYSTQGPLPWSLLFEAGSVRSEDADARRDEAAVPSLKRRFFQAATVHDAQVFEFASDRRLDPEKLGRVFAGLGAGVLRAKGIVYLDDASADRFKYVVQYTGAQRQLYSRPWSKDEPRQTQLVFLGTSFDAPALQEALACCQL